MRFNIYRKILIFTLSLLAVFIFISYYLYQNIKQIESGYNGVIFRSAPLVFETKDIKQELYKQTASVARYTIYNNPQYKDEFLNSVEQTKKIYVSLEKKLTTPEGKKQFEDVKNAFAEYQKEAINYLNNREKYKGEALEKVSNFLQEKASIADKQATDYENFISERMVLRTKQNSERIAQINLTTFASLAVLAVIAILITIWFANLISKPLKAISKQAQEIADGILQGKDIKYKGNDELKDVIASFVIMINNLKEVVQIIHDVSGQIDDASKAVTQSSKETAGAADHIAQTVSNMVNSQTEQMQHFRETSQTSEQMSIIVEEISSAVEQITELSKDSATATNTGQQAIAQAQSQMQQIDSSVAQSTQVITRLGESSQKIGEIITVISEIAGQTNLLALNAAIEAARAGEHGKGFAVVAEEVRKLAEQVAQATNETSQIIIQIQKETKAAVESMQIGQQEVAKGTTVINNTGEKFIAISTLLEQMNNKINQIKLQTHELKDSNVTLDKGVKLVHTIAEKSTVDSQTIGAATEEQSAKMSEITYSCNEIMKLVTNLEKIVKHFKI